MTTELTAIKDAHDSLDALTAALAMQACSKYKHLEGKDTFALHVHRFVAVAFLKGISHPELMANPTQKDPAPEVRVANKIVALKKEFGEQATSDALQQVIDGLECVEEAKKQIREEAGIYLSPKTKVHR